MNAIALIILAVLVATSAAQSGIQVDYFYAELPNTCDNPRLWDYAYVYSKALFECSASNCQLVYGGQGANFTRTTTCGSNVQISKTSTYMVQLPCNSIWEAAYYRITSCVPTKDSTTYQLSLFDGQNKVFTVFQCKDKYCGNCKNFEDPLLLQPNQCINGVFTYLFP